MPFPSRLANTLLLSTCLLAPASVAADVSSRIYGGTDADQDDWRWMTGMNIFFPGGDGAFCGSQLLSTQWVLTAAHCLVLESGVSAEGVEFFYDAPFLGPTPPQDREFSEDIITHPDYVAADITRGNDIALVRVNNAPSLIIFPDLADADTVMQLESLPAARRDDAMTALGWGETSPVTSGISPSLQQVTLDYIPRAFCADFWQGLPMGPLPIDHLVCAGESTPPPSAPFGQDTCVGDSGGPLLVGTPDAPVIVGLTSFGSDRGCGLTDVPGVYTSTADLITWIETSTANPPGGIAPAALIDGAILIDTYHSQSPGSSLGEVPFSVGNNSQINPASLLSLTLFSVPGNTFSLALDGITCPAGECNLSAGNPRAPGSWSPGTVDISSASPGADSTVVFGLQLISEEEDYRSSNNRPVVQVYVTDKPDLDLQAPTFVRGFLSANEPQARLNVSVENLSRHQNAEDVFVELTLPPATDLINAGALGCTQNGAVMSCPLNAIPHGNTRNLTLRLQSGDSIARTVPLAVVSGNGTFGAGTSERTVSVVYPQPEGLSLSRPSNGGSIWLLGLVALLLRCRTGSARAAA